MMFSYDAARAARTRSLFRIAINKEKASVILGRAIRMLRTESGHSRENEGPRGIPPALLARRE
jgi:hypothetical protein